MRQTDLMTLKVNQKNLTALYNPGSKLLEEVVIVAQIHWKPDNKSAFRADRNYAQAKPVTLRHVPEYL